MRAHNFLKSLCLTLCFFVLPIKVYTSDLVVFGDSLSDNGNLQALLQAQGLSYPPEATGGRLSNGLLGVEVLADLMGTDLKPALFLIGQQAGTNYAVASARARTANEKPFHLHLQVNAYLASAGAPLPTETTYILAIGGNDLRDAFYTEGYNAYNIISEATNSLADNMQKLLNQGATKIVVVNTPRLTDVPEVKEVINNAESYRHAKRLKRRARLSSYIFNKKLKEKVRQLKRNHPAAHIVSFDLPTFSKQLLKNAEAFGFANTDKGCLSLNSDTLQYTATSFCDLTQDIDTFVFFDQLHFSAEANNYFGRSLYANMPR